MPRQYSSSVRRRISARLRSGEPVAAIAVDTGTCQATLFRWKHQALIDAGTIEGIPSVEADELDAARRRIAALGSELTLQEPRWISVIVSATISRRTSRSGTGRRR